MLVLCMSVFYDSFNGEYTKYIATYKHVFIIFKTIFSVKNMFLIMFITFINKFLRYVSDLYYSFSNAHLHSPSYY